MFDNWSNEVKTILNEKYYDINETAEMLGIAVVTCRQYFKSGKINAKRIGARWHTTETDIQNYLNDKTVVQNGKH